MNEDTILDNPNIEDVNIEVESEDLDKSTNEEILEEVSLNDELDIDLSELEEPETMDESIEENLEEDTDTLEEAEEEIKESTIEEAPEDIEEESIEEEPLADITEEEKIHEEEIVQEINTDENVITTDLNNIKIEFGIEAKGFILSINMMEAMIQKGYIFKDMLDNKVFDAIMIFNGNLENTVMTNDIKIKIDNGKIQLIKA